MLTSSCLPLATHDWIARCAAQLQVLGPAIWDEFASDLAHQLHGAWPHLEPEDAAAAFLRPALVTA